METNAMEMVKMIGFITIGFGVLVFIVILILKKVEDDRGVEGEVKQVISDCRKIESKMEKGFAVFHPAPEDVHIYELLVSREVMTRNPLGGYSFSDTIKKVWDPFKMDPNTVNIIEVKNYQDDDGILKANKDENGNLKDVVTEEDIKREREKDATSTSK